MQFSVDVVASCLVELAFDCSGEIKGEDGCLYVVVVPRSCQGVKAIMSGFLGVLYEALDLGFLFLFCS